jgi:hypothetical protein
MCEPNPAPATNSLNAKFWPLTKLQGQNFAFMVLGREWNRNRFTILPGAKWRRAQRGPQAAPAHPCATRHRRILAQWAEGRMPEPNPAPGPLSHIHVLRGTPERRTGASQRNGSRAGCPGQILPPLPIKAKKVKSALTKYGAEQIFFAFCCVMRESCTDSIICLSPVCVAVNLF